MQDFEFLHSGIQSDEQSEKKNCGYSSRLKIIIVEDDKTFGKTLNRWLSKKLNADVVLYNSPQECLKEVKNGNDDEFCLITDITFEDGSIDGLLLIDLLKDAQCKFISIVMTGFASIENAISATKRGVYHYLTKPFELDSLESLICKAAKEILNKDLSEQQLSLEQSDFSSESSSPSTLSKVFIQKFKIEAPNTSDIFYGMVGRSQKMKEVFNRIEKVAQTDSTVLISGASGTGKELVARAIHSLSRRVQQRMLAVNCGAIPGELLESELFGHVKGAFTGAISNRKGRFEMAHRGTIFLDEIGDMPLLLQVKLLRVLQSREIEPVGSSETVNVDVRIMTATHRDLEKLVGDGQFREDLFYRLNVIPVKVPELRERREDIPLLIGHFLNKFVSADGRNAISFDDEVLEILMGYQWPGNVRELENLMERLVILKGGSKVEVSDLPSKFLTSRPASFLSNSPISLPDEGVDLKDFLNEIEDSLILQALERTEGNRNQASKLLKMNRTTLIEKIKKKGLLFL